MALLSIQLGPIEGIDESRKLAVSNDDGFPDLSNILGNNVADDPNSLCLKLLEKMMDRDRQSRDQCQSRYSTETTLHNLATEQLVTRYQAEIKEKDTRIVVLERKEELVAQLEAELKEKNIRIVALEKQNSRLADMIDGGISKLISRFPPAHSVDSATFMVGRHATSISGYTEMTSTWIKSEYGFALFMAFIEKFDYEFPIRPFKDNWCAICLADNNGLVVNEQGHVLLASEDGTKTACHADTNTYSKKKVRFASSPYGRDPKDHLNRFQLEFKNLKIADKHYGYWSKYYKVHCKDSNKASIGLFVKNHFW